MMGTRLQPPGTNNGRPQAGAHARGHALGVRGRKTVSGPGRRSFGIRAPSTETLPRSPGLYGFRKVSEQGEAPEPERREYRYSFCS